MTLTGEEFEAEKRYQTLMLLVRQMVTKGLLTEAEYRQAAAKYAAALSPPTGDLLASNRMLFTPEGGDPEDDA